MPPSTFLNPIVGGLTTALITGGIWGIYTGFSNQPPPLIQHNHHQQQPLLDPSRTTSSRQHSTFTSGFQLGLLYPRWSPYLKHQGYEALYNFNHSLLQLPPSVRLLLGLIERTQPDPYLSVDSWDLNFEHPIGLGPGFLRSGDAIDGYLDLGFSFVECGSVTLYPQQGNPPQRLFALPIDGGHGDDDDDVNETTKYNQIPKTTINNNNHNTINSSQQQSQQLEQLHQHQTCGALNNFIHNVGNPNDGARVLAKNLEKYYNHFQQHHQRSNRGLIGVNLALNSFADAKQDPQNYQDFLTMYNILHRYTNYFVINVNEDEAFIPVSSPLSLDAYDQKHPLLNNRDLFIHQLKQDGITLDDLTAAGLQLPNSINNLPPFSTHYEMNPAYVQLVESLLQLRDSSPRLPFLEQHINDVVKQDDQLLQYYRNKLSILEAERLQNEVALQQTMSQSLNRSFDDDPSLRNNHQEYINLAPSLLVEKLSSIHTRLDSINIEIQDVLECLSQHEAQIYNKPKEISDSNQIALEYETIQLLHQDELKQQSEQERQELAMNVVSKTLSQDEMETALHTFKAKREKQIEIENDPYSDTFTHEIESIRQFAQFRRVDEKQIHGYRVYDRSQLTTIGTMNNIDLSRSFSRKKLYHSKPKILFKIAADIEPRLGILFAKFCTLHGVDGLVIGGPAVNRQCFPQPNFYPNHDHFIDYIQNRPSMSSNDFDSTNISLQLDPPVTPQIEHMIQQQLQSESMQPVLIPDRLQPGFVSGPILNQTTTRLIATIFQHTNGQIPIIGSGGISNAHDIYQKILAGATLVQLHSSLYDDITIVPKLKSDLHQLLQNDVLEHQQSHIISPLSSITSTPQTTTQHSPQSTTPLQEHLHQINLTRTADQKKWKLNHIIGKMATQYSYFDIDPYEQCVDDLEQVKYQFNEWKRKQHQQ